MSIRNPGTRDYPLRIAIIGSGPAGFYAAGHLFHQNLGVVEIDMFDRLPSPYGLVRYGVAPDHQRVKSVTKSYDKIAMEEGFRFYGDVEFDKDINLDDLIKQYHQIIFATGAQAYRTIDIPGMDLRNCLSAMEIVGWYSGHPEYTDLDISLSMDRVAVIGMGNVALDIARILCRTEEELIKTDIPDYALEVLSKSRIKDVFVIGRRGPLQAAFTIPELIELGHLSDAEVITLREEVELDEFSNAELKKTHDQIKIKRVEILKSLAQRSGSRKSRRIHLRFMLSPVEISGDHSGNIASIRLRKNVLYATETGTIRARETESFEELGIGMVIQAIGYRGVPLTGVPFNQSWGVILNENGRVTEYKTRAPITGLYTAGWIKRGPVGVIGTNKIDASQTVECMLEDYSKGIFIEPLYPQVSSAEEMVKKRKPNYFTYKDWARLDEMEVARGIEQGRPRIKFTSVKDMLDALGKGPRS